MQIDTGKQSQIILSEGLPEMIKELDQNLVVKDYDLPLIKYVKTNNGMINSLNGLSNQIDEVLQDKEMKQIQIKKGLLLQQYNLGILSETLETTPLSQSQLMKQDEKADEAADSDMIIEKSVFKSIDTYQKVSPQIFTKKLSFVSNKSKRIQPDWVSAFENVLSLVVQLYYKKDLIMNEIINPKSEETKKEFLKQPKINLDKKPGRKRKPDWPDNITDNYEQKQFDEKESGTYSKYNQLQQDILDMLISPLRQDLPFEKWSLKEIAIFECAICKYGKNFDFIAQLVPKYYKFKNLNQKVNTKTAQDIIEFYFCWKFSTHYRIWKTKQTSLKRVIQQQC